MNVPDSSTIAPDADTAQQRDAVMRALRATVTMMGNMVGHHTEVVLHDLSQPQHSIVELCNGHVSGRSVGNAILSGPGGDLGFDKIHSAIAAGNSHGHDVIGHYQTVTRDGRSLRAASVIYRDACGQPFAALCINADLSGLQAALSCLTQLITPPAASTPAPAPQPAVDILMADIIEDAVRSLGKPVNLMNKREKIQAVQTMQQRGLFTVKGGVETAAAALAVSRYTIYNYLDDIRSQAG